MSFEVAQDIREYQKPSDALCLLKLMTQGEKEIQEGKGRKQTDVFADINAMLETRNGVGHHVGNNHYSGF